MLTFTADRGHLVTLADGFPDEEFLPEADDRFYSTAKDLQIRFLKDDNGKIGGLLCKEDGKERKLPRIGPLFHSLKPQPDHDTARTEKVIAALKAIEQGGKTLADSPLLTAGARTDFGIGRAPDLTGIRSITFLLEEDVSAHEIERHKGRVNRVLHYRMASGKPDRGLLVHITADGLITDYDVVDD
jgi:hypothetical protein